MVEIKALSRNFGAALLKKPKINCRFLADS